MYYFFQDFKLIEVFFFEWDYMFFQTQYDN